ncbi:pirin family protein [Miniphocaeibacter halophilus]|uniref:Pirin family protein n=1 Tax=Miniphocaeibacter halophilus TaxID=2931922 RepID=A0AC61N198_9FIRM|nr:pirin family protein [Miniphocaeibacter halophilus]QQK08941.1 pirin family protein [Miniphocaeibacter halophilus]
MKILQRGEFSRRLEVQSPFILAAYHDDRYPKGNGSLGPIEDNTGKWSMYYGKNVPGFPKHPHRGFETVTYVERGVVDHSDGLGSNGRYANGDVQWMTAGKGLQHCEMFPLFNTDRDNPLDLFQIWLNLDSKNKMVEPDYKMLWAEEIPVIEKKDTNNKNIKIVLVAGSEDNIDALKPTKNSWAYEPENHVGIKFITLESGAEYSLQKKTNTLNRAIYFYFGNEITLDDVSFSEREYAFVKGNETLTITNTGKEEAKILLLEGEPIKEPVVAYGPFVMNTREEIKQAYLDYENTEFGGWPFYDDEVVHSINTKRYAKYSDGIIEYPKEK